MKKILTIALAAATLAGGAAAVATPASAADRHGNNEWREHAGWRDRDGWRRGDRNWGDGWRWRNGGYWYGAGSACRTSWRWNPYWGRNVRVTRCD